MTGDLVKLQTVSGISHDGATNGKKLHSLCKILGIPICQLKL